MRTFLNLKKLPEVNRNHFICIEGFQKRVVDQTIDMLEAIKDMTEYDYNFCFKEKEEEEKYDKRNM